LDGDNASTLVAGKHRLIAYCCMPGERFSWEQGLTKARRFGRPASLQT